MRVVSTNNCEVGMKLAKPVYDKDNRMLLNTGHPLSEAVIERLVLIGIPYLYIVSSAIDNKVTAAEPLVTHKLNAVRKMENLFNDIKNGNHKSYQLTHGEMIREFNMVFERLLQEIKQKEELLSLLTHIHNNDEYVFEHSLNVTLYSLAIAKKLNMNDKDLYLIGLGAMLHDIGKTFVPSEILNKAGKLTEEEFIEVQKHTEYGFEFLKKEPTIPLLVAHCAYQHHERLDGTGYPRKLKEAEIHPFAKIIAVADVFDALTSNRCYRKAMLPHKALEILYEGRYSQFDSKILEAFKHSIALYPVGLKIQLSTGEIGTVINYNPFEPQHPNIKIVKNAKGEEIEPYEIKLSEHPSLAIVYAESILDDSNIDEEIGLAG